MMQKISKFSKYIFTGTFMLAGLFFVFIGFRGMKNAREFLPTTAVIRSITEVPGVTEDDATTYEVMVEYTVDGKNYVSDIGDYNKGEEVGSTIDILYNPKDPEGIQRPGTTGWLIPIIIGAVVFIVPILYAIYKKTRREKTAEANADIFYAASVKGEERELYFLSDLGTAKIGHHIEDASRKVLYEAKVVKFTLAKPTEMEFIDYQLNRNETHMIGHTIETEYSTILIDNYSTFTFDGEDIWDHLKRYGIRIEAGLMEGKKLWPQYRIYRDGEEIALLHSSNRFVHEEDVQEGKLKNLLPSSGFYRIFTKEQNLDLLFLVIMALARTNAADETGGSYGILFGNKKKGN